MKTKEGFRAWLAGLFSKRQNPLIINLGEGVLEGDPSAIPSLATHPGFLALVHKLRIQRASLEAKVVSSRHESIRDVDFLIAGIAWVRFLEREIAEATQKSRTAFTRQTTVEELAEFQKIRSFIDSVGGTTTQN